MSTGKPSMQVRLAAEREVSLFVIVLHSVLCLLIVVQALNIPLLWLLLPVTVFSFVLSWRQFVSRSGRGSIRTIYLDACDRVYVSVGNDVRRPAGIHAIHMYGGGILLCLSVEGMLLARAAVIGRRSASTGQIRRWKIRLTQLSGGEK